MTITIRRATVEDARLLAKLNRAVHEPHAKQCPDRYKPFIPNNPELIKTYEERVNDETCFTLIAEDDNTAVGYVQFFVQEKPENVFRYDKIDCHIDQLAVLETHQNRGIGKLLIEEATRIGQEHGAHMITLGVESFNHRAIKFYEKLGFTVSSHQMSLNIIENNK